MTYPEGRKPITWRDLIGPQSTWEGEAKALRAENERLRRAMRAACTFCEVNAAPTAYKILMDALRQPPQRDK